MITSFRTWLFSFTEYNYTRKNYDGVVLERGKGIGFNLFGNLYCLPKIQNFTYWGGYRMIEIPPTKPYDAIVQQIGDGEPFEIGYCTVDYAVDGAKR